MPMFTTPARCATSSPSAARRIGTASRTAAASCPGASVRAGGAIPRSSCDGAAGPSAAYCPKAGLRPVRWVQAGIRDRLPVAVTGQGRAK